MKININPAASGNKTQSGVGGLLTVLVGASVAYGLNVLGIADEQAAIIAGAATSAITSGIWTAWGIIHKWIKSKKKKEE